MLALFTVILILIAACCAAFVTLGLYMVVNRDERRDLATMRSFQRWKGKLS